MKNLLCSLQTVLLAVGLLALMSGCKSVVEPLFGGAATISIEKIGTVDYTSFEVRFVPSDNAASFRYAIGEASDLTDFDEGSLEGIVKVDGSEAVSVVFEDLISDKVYTVYAVACDASGKEGEIATVKIPTADNNFLIEQQYVTDRSAGFRFTISGNYMGGRYYLGTKDDRQAFESGNLGEEFADMPYKGVNVFNLEPATDYVFYAQSVDRGGNYSLVMEFPFTTEAEGDCPLVELTYENNIFEGHYVLTPNSKCGKVTVLVANKGDNDEMINSGSHWCGDIVGMISSWETLSDSNLVTVAQDGNPAEVTFYTAALKLEAVVEIYALVYDTNDNVAGLQYFEAVTPSFNPEAGDSEVSVEISDITAYGATYTYTKGENTFAFMYDTVDADWYDDFVENDPSYYQFYLHDLLFASGRFWSYGQETTVYTEEFGMPGKRYYAAGCPMNENGPEGGWGDLVLVEYTTLSE